ncbi:MAG: 6,7-dimethyl-8-ribityllumazine synthase [Gemmatimonadales bacterium]
MAEITGRLRAVGRVAIIVSRYNQIITTKLLAGALECCREAGIAPKDVDVIWTPGAFELVVCCTAAARTGRYACLVALGAVIRGETPHFDFVAGSAAQGLTQVAVQHALPVGFGVLTVDSLSQANARAGGSAGNKGYEATEAAIRSADVIATLQSSDA